MSRTILIDRETLSQKLREAGADERTSEAIIRGIVAAGQSLHASEAEREALAGAKRSDIHAKNVPEGENVPPNDPVTKGEVQALEAATLDDIRKLRESTQARLQSVKQTARERLARARVELADVEREIKNLEVARSKRMAELRAKCNRLGVWLAGIGVLTGAKMPVFRHPPLEEAWADLRRTSLIIILLSWGVVALLIAVLVRKTLLP